MFAVSGFRVDLRSGRVTVPWPVSVTGPCLHPLPIQPPLFPLWLVVVVIRHDVEDLPVKSRVGCEIIPGAGRDVNPGRSFIGNEDDLAVRQAMEDRL